MRRMFTRLANAGHVTLPCGVPAFLLSTFAAGASGAAVEATSPVASPANSAAQSAGQDSALQEIVVTATRRAEEISKVPISIVALDRVALQQSGVKSVQDLAAIVPGIEFDTAAGFGPNTLTNIAIRGINSNVGTSTTGIYIDDVPLQTRIVALSYWGNPFPLMFDVDRVEVDRGPQGTLFGAGAEGGAIRFISPEPGLVNYSGFSHAETSFTDHGAPSYEAGAAFGGPMVTDTLGFRVSAWYRRDGGYVDRVDPLNGSTAESNANYTESYVVRAAVAFVPAEGVKVTPSIFVQSVRNNDSNAYFEYLSDPGDEVFKNGRLLRQPSGDRFYLPSLKLEADLGGATLTSVTGYFHREGSLTQDATSYNGAVFGAPGYGSPLGSEYPTSYSDAGPVYLQTGVRLFTQEIRASSNDADAPLRWTTGVFYSTASQTDTESVQSPFYSVGFFGNAPDDPLFYSQITSKDTQVAAFGQVDYRILPAVTLTAGLRVSHNVAKYIQAQSGPISDTEFPQAAGSLSQTPVIPKAEVSYQITDRDLLYVSASKGYRVGGANQPIPLASANNPAGCPLSAEPTPFSADSVWSYEIGSKNRLFDGRLKLDSSAFYVDWSNIQQQVYFNSCSFGFIANTGSATSKGFDFSSQFAVTDRLTGGLSVAYTDARITKTVTFDGSPLVEAGDAVGTLPGVLSPWNITTTAQYDFDLSGHEAFVRAQDVYHSRNPGPFNSMIVGTPLYAPSIPANPPTNVVDLRAGVNWSSIDIGIFANNVMNRHPALYRYEDTVSSTLYTDTTLRPRTVGVSANYKF